MAVRLIFTLICDDVRIERSNKLIVVGLYNRVIGFPNVGQASLKGQTPVGQAPKFALPSLCFVRRWIVDSPGVKARTELIDPNGQSVPIGEEELPVPAEHSYHQQLIRMNGIILIPGVYTIRTTYDEKAPSTYDEQFEVKIQGNPS